MELSENQSALIMTESAEGEITVDVASSNIYGLTGEICQAIARKLMNDEAFLDELLNDLEE